MRWSIRIFNPPPPPRATPCVQIPAPWGKNCVQIPTQVLDLIKNFFVKGKNSNPDQFLSTLSPKPSAFCLWKWIFFTLKHPHIKSQNTSIQLGRLAKSASNCAPQSGKVQILYPPGMDDRQITMGCPEGRMLKLQIDRHIIGNETNID